MQLAHRYRFDLTIAPDGTPWEPLDSAYQRRKKRRAGNILVLDAYLRDQLSYRADNNSVEFGTNRIYGAAHQFGTDDIPARPLLGVSSDDGAHILNLARKHIASVSPAQAGMFQNKGLGGGWVRLFAGRVGHQPVRCWIATDTGCT